MTFHFGLYYSHLIISDLVKDDLQNMRFGDNKINDIIVYMTICTINIWIHQENIVEERPELSR